MELLTKVPFKGLLLLFKDVANHYHSLLKYLNSVFITLVQFLKFLGTHWLYI